MGVADRLSPRRTVAGAVALAVVLRVPYLNDPLYPDEGGYLLVAEQWTTTGPHLYGELWVDRPPLLLAFFRLATELGGTTVLRLLACLAVAGLVVAAGWAGWQLAGARGARWSAVAAAALSASPLAAGQAAEGELLAAPLVLVACAATLAALARAADRSAAALGTLAGLAGGVAVLVKQSVLDGLVFAVVLVVASAYAGSLSRRSASRLLGWVAAGAVVPLAGLHGWAWAYSPGVDVMYAELFGFRSDALAVVLSWNLEPPLDRALWLLALSLLTGIVPVLVCVAHAAARRAAVVPTPFSVALGAMVVTAGLSMVLGAGFWSQYLLGLLPAVALASAALAGAGTRPHRWAARTVGAVAVSGTLAAVAGAVVHGVTGYPSTTVVALSSWLRSSAAAGDTVVVTYGYPNVARMAGVQPAYPYLWSLATRTYDADLDRLTRTLRGPAAPTWVVEVHGLHWWGLDDDGGLRTALSRHYEQVASVCGYAVLRHTDAVRTPAWTGDRCPG